MHCYIGTADAIHAELGYEVTQSDGHGPVYAVEHCDELGTVGGASYPSKEIAASTCRDGGAYAEIVVL